MMGLTLTEDKVFANRKYKFQFGLKNEDGNIEQITTPDIAYGMLLTRYGLIGTFFLVRLIYLLMRRLYKYRRKSELSMALFGFLCSQFVAAVSATAFVDPIGWINIFFLYSYAMRMIAGDQLTQTK